MVANSTTAMVANSTTIAPSIPIPSIVWRKCVSLRNDRGDLSGDLSLVRRGGTSATGVEACIRGAKMAAPFSPPAPS